MSDLTGKFAALSEQDTLERTALLSEMEAINANLTNVFNTLDLMNNNASLNTQLLLKAIGLNSPCLPCPTPSLIVPPTDTTGLAINEDKCKRTQAFLHAMQEIFTLLDSMNVFAVTFNPSIVNDAISQVIDSLANGDTTPLPSFLEAAAIAGNMLNFSVNNIIAGTSLVDQFMPLYFDLRDVIYVAGSAASAQTAYNGIIGSSEAYGAAKPVLTTAAYNALWSYYFDPASDPNLTGYSGTVCGFDFPGITECIVAESHPEVIGGDTYHCIFFDPTYSGNPIFSLGNFEGFTFELLSLAGATDVRIDSYSTGDVYQPGGTIYVANPNHTQSTATNAIGIHSNMPNIGGPFTVRICPPGL